MSRVFNFGKKKEDESVQNVAPRQSTELEPSRLSAENVIEMEQRVSKLFQEKELDEFFPMHCVTTKDLLSFDFLPRHDELIKMKKFVCPGPEDTRPVLFISHQQEKFEIEILILGVGTRFIVFTFFKIFY